jgi:hypothetical protein
MSTNAPPRPPGNVPTAAIDWIRSVFAGVNRQVSSTLSRIPTNHEPELDLQLIAALNRTPAITAVDGWTVYIQTHFLGGRRHFYNWEVADIGLLVIFRDRGRVLRIKVGLLQSKRLYSAETQTLPNFNLQARIGFATLLQDPEAFRALVAGRTFAFSNTSEYLAISKDNDQVQAITAYEKLSGIPVYYLMYNPVSIPWTARVPATELPPLPPTTVGCRVLRFDDVHAGIATKPAGYHPTYHDLLTLSLPYVGVHQGGWALEHFVADELLACHEGHIASDETDHVLEGLFYRRSGPISAAIAITVEAPDGVDLILP